MMTTVPAISIVIPCLNEADSIPEVIPNLIAQTKDKNVEIIVVDDGSSDNSVALLKNYSEVVLIQNATCLGYGGALKKGFQQAKGQYLTFLDLDRTYNSADLEMMYQEITQKNLWIVFGNRMSQKNEMPRARFIGNWLYARLLQVMFGVNIQDACTGFRIFKRELAPKIVALKEDGLNFSIAFTVLVLKNRLSFSQVPIRYDERIGRSKLSIFFDGFRFLRSIFTNYFRAVK